jgi:hypothetical protein
MSGDTFQRRYEQLTDNELAQVLADKENLVPEAAEALDGEVQRRHFVSPTHSQWTQQPGSDKRVESLEDYNEYRGLVERKKAFGRYWYLLAMGPFILGLVLGRTSFENSGVLIIATLFWAMCVAVYGLILSARLLGFRCPQCSQSFGRGSECFSCGFPRNAMNKSLGRLL